ncbi:hypothetical protein BDZ45DRAFT_751783 [Acephala macrosclerotiorum]|nr:hypothetical protein BDZ45DRAFT_751783 [Acephala macrosclerotiorum]
MATRTQPFAEIFRILCLFGFLASGALVAVVAFFTLAPFLWITYIIFRKRPKDSSNDSQIKLIWQKATLENFRTLDSKIYHLVVPLAFSQRSGLSIASEPGASAFLNFKSLQHWAIFVGNVIYKARRDQEIGSYALRREASGKRFINRNTVLNQNSQTFAWLFFSIIRKEDATVNIKVNDRFFPPRLSKTVYKVVVAISIVTLLSTLKSVCFVLGSSFFFQCLSAAYFVCLSITILSSAPDFVRFSNFLEYLEVMWWQKLAVKRFEERKKEREYLVSGVVIRIRKERRWYQFKKWMKRSRDEAEKLYEQVDFAMVLEEWLKEAEFPLIEAGPGFPALRSSSLKKS